MNLRRVVQTALATGLMAAIGTAFPAAASTNESPVDTTGGTGFIRLQYGDHTVNSRLATTIEVDSYTFAGGAGDSVRILLSTLSTGLDPQLLLRSPTGSVLNSTSCSGNTSGGFGIRCSAMIDASLSTAGIYTLNVSDINADEAGHYIVHVDTYPPRNNWIGIAYDAPVNDQLGHVNDFDYLAFQGVAGTGVRLTARTTSTGVDPRLEVWDPHGALISDTWCSGNTSGGFGITCTTGADLALTKDGVYKVSLSDVGWDETGSYTLGVSCLFGECASMAPIPAPVPEPETYALMLAGLGIVGAAQRFKRRVARDA